MARHALAEDSPAAVLVLGAAHDLTGPLQVLEPGCAVVRVWAGAVIWLAERRPQGQASAP